MKRHRIPIRTSLFVLPLLVLALGATGGPRSCVPAPEEPLECTTNDDCLDANYCAKAEGDCDGVGRCEPRPEACYFLWAPVCGCDGRTYSNDCLAAAEGVNVAYAGECEPERCWGNDMCARDEYCYFHDCAAETGACEPRPDECPRLWDPVCGCDNVTYPNRCRAAMNGQSILHAGECAPQQCWGNDWCPPEQYCLYASCDMRSGACAPRPDVCPDIYMPVCGCDGVTYGNACDAAAAGQTVAHEGECRITN